MTEAAERTHVLPTEEFLKSASRADLEGEMRRMKGIPGADLAKDWRYRRAVRDAIDRLYRELDARNLKPDVEVEEEDITETLAAGHCAQCGAQLENDNTTRYCFSCWS